MAKAPLVDLLRFAKLRERTRVGPILLRWFRHLGVMVGLLACSPDVPANTASADSSELAAPRATLVFELGGRHDGPRFGHVLQLVYRDDTDQLAILDGLHRKLYMFTSDGTFTDSAELRPPPGRSDEPPLWLWPTSGDTWKVRYSGGLVHVAGSRQTAVPQRLPEPPNWLPYPGSVDPDGCIVEARAMTAEAAPDSVRIIVSPSRSCGDFIENLPGMERTLPLAAGTPVLPPNSPRPLVLLSDTLALFAWSDAYQVAIRSLDGDTLAVLFKNEPPVKVSDRKRAELVEGWADPYQIAISQVPDHEPVLGGLALGPSGEIWTFPRVVGHDAGTVADLFRRGEHCARLHLPISISVERHRPVVTVHTIYAIRASEDRFDQVVALRLPPGWEGVDPC